MRIMLLGKNGQVGWELQRSLAPLGQVIALDRHDQGGDLSQPQAVAVRILAERPDVIVNAAAYTAVDRAESDLALCQTINAGAVAEIAQAAASVGALLVHFSTDYVFDGSGVTPWVETDTTGPLNAYGRSKLDGERAIAASNCKHLIFRTSWVYGSRGSNFAKTMLRLANERDQLQVVDDQFGAPTGADLIADVAAHTFHATLNKPAAAGLYHLVAAGETTWHGYASYCLELARAQGATLRVEPDRVIAVPSTAFPTPATRPRNSRLNSTKLQQQVGVTLPDWRQGVQRLIQQII